MSETEIKQLIDELELKSSQLDKKMSEFQAKNLSMFDSMKKTFSFDEAVLKEWYDEYWLIYPSADPNEHFIAVPKFIPFSVGWLDHTTKGYNIFKINQYTQWLGEMPEFLRKDLNIQEPQKIFVSDGNLIFDEGKEEDIKDKYGDILSSIGRGTAKIKLGREFDLIAKIIADGSLPFVPRKVDKEDLLPNDTNISFEGKRIYQQEAWDSFLKYGAQGVFWLTGAGKDIYSSYALSRIQVKKDGKILPNLYLSPNLTILQQMENDYFPKYAPRLLEDIKAGRLILSTYQGYEKIKGLEFGLVIFGECHVLPADSFSRAATLKTKYRIGQSASPYREDGKHNLIFALTGFPVGLNWKDLMKLLGKHYHDVNVYIVSSMEQKIKLATNLVAKDTKTLLFVDKIDIGEKLSNLLGVPFIHGATRNRLEILKESKVFVASRVLEMGISIKDLEHVIEVDFQYGSKREEVQRTGRLLHSETKDSKKHDIIMTKDEFDNYGKRLHGLVEKGFKINLKPMISGTFQIKKQEIATKKKTSSSGWAEVIDNLFEEGYFQIKRKLADVSVEIKKRNMPYISDNVRSKLNSMVKSKKLYKIAEASGNCYVKR